MEESYFEPDPGSEEEQFRRRDMAPFRRMEKREEIRATSRRYTVGVVIAAVVVLICYLLRG